MGGVGGDGAFVGRWVGMGVVMGVVGWATCLCWPTSSDVRRDTTECVRVRDIPCSGGLTHSGRLPPFHKVSGVFERSTSHAMPCLAGFRVLGNKSRGILNHCLPGAMLLNLPVAKSTSEAYLGPLLALMGGGGGIPCTTACARGRGWSATSHTTADV